MPAVTTDARIRKADQSPKSYLTYRNTATGETIEFESAKLMEYMQDPAWVEQWEWEASRVESPYDIKAPGFSMMDMEGEDRAADLLPAEDGMLIVTVHHLDKVKEKGVREIRFAFLRRSDCRTGR